MSDINDLIMYLPKAGNNQSIAVGFEDESALYPLRKILWDIKNGINVDNNNRDKENRDTQTRNLENFKKEWKKKKQEELEKNQKANDDQRKKLGDILSGILDNVRYTKDSNDKLEKISQYALRWSEYVIDALDKHLEAAMKVGGVYRDIESSGVFLKDGFKDLGSTAYNLGMTYEDLAGHLKKSSPILARLNGTMGDGLKVFESSISNIDKNLNLSNSEKAAIFENVLSNLSPDQLMRMSQEQMNIEINKTAKEMKMLSMATGKSVDLLNKENEAKARTLRENVWKRTHRQAYSVLQSLGITEDSELMDYIMSGGGKMTAGILTKMQNDPFMQRMLPMLTRSAMTNNLNSQTLASLYQQNAHLATFKSGYADRASFDPARMMASGASDLFQNTQFYEFYDFFKNTNLNGDMASQYFSPARAGANNALGNMQSLAENKNRWDIAKLNALSGGENGVGQTAGFWSGIYDKGASAINLYNKLPQNALTGILATGAGTLATNALKIGGDAWFYRSVLRFDKAVDKFSGENGISGFSNVMKKGILGSIDKRTKLGRKLKPLLNLNDKASKSWLGKNINVGFGKHKLRLGAVSSGLVKGGLAAGGGWLLEEGNDYLKEKGYVEEGGKMDTALKAGSKALSWGGQGAMLGSIFGPLGTAVGGIGGALLGAGVSLWDSLKQPNTSSPSVKPYTSGSITTPTSKIDEENKQNGAEMLQCMKSTNDKMENMCMLLEENNKISYQTRIDNRMVGEHQN